MFVESKIFSLGTRMEVPSKLRKTDGDAKRGCIRLAEVVRTKSPGTGNARKPVGGSKCSAAFGKSEFTFSTKSTNLEHESYSPTFLSPMDNATGPELHVSLITGDFPNQIVCVPDKIDATDFPSDFQCKDSDLQSTRLVEGNKDRKGKQVPDAHGLCETNMRSEVQNAGRDAKCSSSPSQKPLDTSKLGTYLPTNTCSHNPRVGENQHFQALPAVQKNPLNGPALSVIWKGNFEIHDCPSNLRFCEGVLAHSSAKVSRRAYSFSKKISGNLHFVMYSQDQFFPDIFKLRSPDRDDIALYFYPGNYERSKRQYSYLLKFMERKGLLLRSWMGSVELLVYPSSLLEVDSQKLGNCYFMWGVFHRIRGDASSSNARAQCTSPRDSN